MYLSRPTPHLYPCILCVFLVRFRSSACLPCATKKSDAEVVIWETFIVAGYRVFLLHKIMHDLPESKIYPKALLLTPSNSNTRT